jgi:hypothetical protein
MKKGFIMADAGIFNLLEAAVGKRCDEGFIYTVSGDLSQMSAQKRFLESQGVVLGQVDVYPALRTEKDFLAAVRLIWENRIDGWWHYEKEIVENLKLCSKEDFRK